MIRIPFASLACLALGVSALCAQNSPPIYAESFRKGQTRITEEKFQVNLTPEAATYRERIKDSAGNDRYEVMITPQGPEGDTKITSWRVRMRDLHHAIYSNILLVDQEPTADPKNNLWWLNPNRFGLVPIHIRRIIKVDSFYVAFEVKQIHSTPLDSPYLDSMTVQFSFTNSDPRATP